MSRQLHCVKPCICPTSLPSVLPQPHTSYLCAFSGSGDLIIGPLGLVDGVCFSLLLPCLLRALGCAFPSLRPPRKSGPCGSEEAGTSVLSPSPVCSAAYSVSRPSSQNHLLLNSTPLPHPRSINAIFNAHTDTNTPRPSLEDPISSVAPKFHCSVLLSSLLG